MDTGTQYVRGIEGSGNRETAEVLTAARLGQKRFEAANAELLDGLPNLRRGILGLWDSWRMNLAFSVRHEWRQFRRDLRLPAQVATRQATARDVMNALRVEHKDILLVVAHNDGRYVYLPSGERIAFADIGSVRREVAPHRVVVLITCKGASKNEGLDSIAKLILDNRLARSVFASEDFVDARNLPNILSRLLEAPSLRTALESFGFDQYAKSSYGPTSDLKHLANRVLRSRLPTA
jgi:hypothetical protein